MAERYNHIGQQALHILSNDLSMPKIQWFLFPLLLVLATAAQADDQLNEITEGEEPLLLSCEYTKDGKYSSEIAKIGLAQQTDASEAQTAQDTTRILRSREADRIVNLLVTPGNFGECVFPSGKRVRVKVGEGDARPYGRCGGSAMIYASIWVNRRQISSQEWVSGHCRRDNGNPDVSYRFSLYGEPVMEKCHTATLGDVEEGKEPLKVCIFLPSLQRYPIDNHEYAKPGNKLPKVGDIRLSGRSAPVCKTVQRAFRDDPDTFWDSGSANARGWTEPEWQDTQLELPEDVGSGKESVFDLDNDGKRDYVLFKRFDNNYYDGNLLLMLAGRNVPPSPASDALLGETSRLLPCQYATPKPAIRSCPPFSQEGDGTGVVIPASVAGRKAFFSTRYTILTPFFYQHTTYLALRSKVQDESGLLAIIKPLPQGRYQPLCMLRRIEPHF